MEKQKEFFGEHFEALGYIWTAFFGETDNGEIPKIFSYLPDALQKVSSISSKKVSNDGALPCVYKRNKEK